VFVNREAALDWLWKLTEKHITAPVIKKKQLNEMKLGRTHWDERLATAEPSRLPGGGFIVLVGASGIGKTTMVTDGLVKLLSHNQKKVSVSSPAGSAEYLDLLKDCLDNNYFFVLHNKSVGFLEPDNGKNIGVALALRLLYLLNSPERQLDTDYIAWMRNLWVSKPDTLTISDVLKTLFDGDTSSKLIYVVIYEAQNLSPKLFLRVLGHLHSEMLELRKKKIHMIPILSGINPTKILSPINASSFEYNNIVLPLLSQLDLIHEIIVALDGRSPPVNLTTEQLNFIMTVTAGHPRLLENFFSAASAILSDPPSPELRTFFPVGFEKFLNKWSCKEYWNIAAEMWKAMDSYLPTVITFLKSL